jgi:outer membrane protein TolC
MRAAFSILLVLFLLVPAPALAPLAAAQEGGAPPQGGTPPGTPAPEADYPGAAQIETIPADAIVLSLDEAIRKAIENNLNIAVKRYDPMNSATLVTNEEAVFDPTITGTAASSQSESRQVVTTPDPVAGAIVAISAFSQRTDKYTAAWTDPLTTGGSYRIELDAQNPATSQMFQTQAAGVTNTTNVPTYTQYETTWTLGFTQPLLRNMGRQVSLWQIDVAKYGLAATESSFRQVVIDTITSAVKTYADLNFAIMQLRTARFSLKLAQDFLDQNRIKVRVGTLAPIEITQAEAQVADQDESVIVFEANLRLAEDQLRAAIGMRKDSPDWTRPVRPSDPLTLKEYTPDESVAMDAAMANRPDVEQARLNIQSWETTVRARKNQKRWALDFQGLYGNFGNDVNYSKSVDDLTGGNQTNWSAGLNLSVPISNRSAIANYTRAEVDLEQARTSLQQVEQNVRLDVRNSVRNVETTLKRVKAAQTNVRLQREKLAAEQKKFENGMSTSFQVLSFQNDLSSAETRQNLATSDYNKALADLERSKGTILAYFGILLKDTPDKPSQEGSSAALRLLWHRPADYVADPGLRLADHAAAEVRLPAEFAFEGGRVFDRTGSTTVPTWRPAAGGADAAPAGGR